MTAPGTTPAKTPPATPTGDATPTGKATATAEAEAIDQMEVQSTPSPSPTPKPRPTFAASRALADVRALAHLGVRSAGSGGEKRGAAFIAKRLRAAGVTPELRTFRLPNGRTSRNVVARFPGATRKTIILGAHMDTKAPSPGANDNGSGCGALLEIARCLARRPAYPTVKLVFFGSEEIEDLLLAALMGVLIPIAMLKLSRDPAVGASVMITAVTDSGGFFIFLGLATLILL